LRLSIWVQSRTKRDVNSLSASEMSEAESFKMGFVRPDDVKDTLNPHSSNDINIRVKRYKSSVSQSKGMGCSLGTCSVHDLAHRLFQLTDKHKDGSAPMDKISPLGYGRRRRSLPENRVTFQLLGRRLRPAWKSTNRGEKLRELLRRT
ncbi:ADML protein, partial [Amia calva]|nr:ADML protein [Amia calva]